MTLFAYLKWTLQLLCGLKVAGLGEGFRKRSGWGEMGVRGLQGWAGRGWQV